MLGGSIGSGRHWTRPACRLRGGASRSARIQRIVPNRAPSGTSWSTAMGFRSACGGDGDTAAASPGALIYEVPLAVLIRDAALPVLGGGYSGYVTSVFITSQEQACSPHYAMLHRSPLENGRRSIPESTDLFS